MSETITLLTELSELLDTMPDDTFDFGRYEKFRNEYLSIRIKIKEKFPKAPMFKKYIYTLSDFDYTLPQMKKEGEEIKSFLITQLFNK